MLGRPVVRHSPARLGKGKRMLQSAMREVHTNEPSTVARADVSEARKEKMRVAIAYSKARRRGARV